MLVYAGLAVAIAASVRAKPGSKEAGGQHAVGQ